MRGNNPMVSHAGPVSRPIRRRLAPSLPPYRCGDHHLFFFFFNLYAPDAFLVYVPDVQPKSFLRFHGALQCCAFALTGGGIAVFAGMVEWRGRGLLGRCTALIAAGCCVDADDGDHRRAQLTQHCPNVQVVRNRVLASYPRFLTRPLSVGSFAPPSGLPSAQDVALRKTVMGLHMAGYCGLLTWVQFNFPAKGAITEADQVRFFPLSCFAGWSCPALVRTR